MRARLADHVRWSSSLNFCLTGRMEHFEDKVCKKCLQLSTAKHPNYKPKNFFKIYLNTYCITKRNIASQSVCILLTGIKNSWWKSERMQCIKSCFLFSWIVVYSSQGVLPFVCLYNLCLWSSAKWQASDKLFCQLFQSFVLLFKIT